MPEEIYEWDLNAGDICLTLMTYPYLKDAGDVKLYEMRVTSDRLLEKNRLVGVFENREMAMAVVKELGIPFIGDNELNARMRTSEEATLEAIGSLETGEEPDRDYDF